MVPRINFESILKFFKNGYKSVQRVLNGFLKSNRETGKALKKYEQGTAEVLKQEERSQQYYDDLAKIWNSTEGATYVSHKTGNIVHTQGYSASEYTVELYKPSRGLTPEEIVKNGKKFYELTDDAYYGLHEYDRYLSHGAQDSLWLSTWNAQRKFWSPERGWQVKDGNPYVRFQTTWKDNSHPLCGLCLG